MYNKVFTKILDSSIWLESYPTRIVWLTFLAAMDQDGMCQFASVANLARRAIVTPDEARAALRVLESPDLDSSDPDNEGRRVERVPGGWVVLNAKKYSEQITADQIRKKTRERVERFRQKQKDVTPKALQVGGCNASVTQSVSVSVSDKDKDLPDATHPRPPAAQVDPPQMSLEQVTSEFQAEPQKAKASEEKKARDDLNLCIDELFRIYCRKFGRDPARYTLTAARRKKAQSRLREREKLCDLEGAVTEAMQCIDNLAASSYHRENGYIDWTEQIFRTARSLKSV